MKKKRLRYSELAVPASPSVVEAPAVVETPPPAAPVAESPVVAEPPAPVEVPPPARPKRNSTPVELARALAAARAAEQPSAPVAPEPHTFRPTVAIGTYRSMRDRTRARIGIVELLVFRVGGERFGVELLDVDEVIDLPVIHHVPEMPPAMLGVVTVRGSLTPVYSPHAALGLPLALREAVLIFRRGGSRIGVLIDDVEDAIPLDLGELRDAPGGDQSETVVLGVIRHDDALVGIVDADALIAACQTAALLEIA